MLVLLAGREAPRGSLGVRIPLRDGKALAVDVFLSAGPGPVPALVIQTHYDEHHLRAAPTAAR